MNSFFFLSPLILQKAIWHATRTILSFFCAFEVRGLDNLPEKHGVIFAANHSSELDPILVPAALPFLSPLLPIFYVSRPREFYQTSGWRQFLYGGFLFKLWGSHAAVAGFKDYKKSLATHLEILRHGGSVFIFPEGKKTRDGNIQKEAHGGVAYLATHTGCPIIPVRIFGDFNMTLSDFLLRKRHMSVVFGSPQYFSPTETAYREQAREVLQRIAALS